MKFRTAGIVQNSCVDGLGLRMAIFFQGCNHFCAGCQNPHTWDFAGGYDTDTDDILKAYKEDELLSGITLTGGDPMYQPVAATVLAKEVKKLGGNVWCYTGFYYEDIVEPEQKELLKYVDVLVDGPFVLDQKDISLLWRGSSNQRILHLKDGEIVGTTF